MSARRSAAASPDDATIPRARLLVVDVATRTVATRTAIERGASRWLRAGAVHVWVLALDGGDEMDDRRLLDDAERARADAVRDGTLRRRWTAARAGLRRVLGACTGVAPETVAFAYDPAGRPRLVARGAPQFSFTHSDGLALCAVAPDAAVGIDVERRAPHVDLEPLAALLARGDAAPAADGPSRDALFDAWVRLEARAKCLGLSLDAAIAATADAARRPPEWSRLAIVPLDVGPDYAAALAVAGLERLDATGAA